MSEAKNDVLIIANDDVVFDYACYKSNIVEFFTNKPNAGLIGANISNLSRPGHTNVNKSTDVLEFVLSMRISSSLFARLRSKLLRDSNNKSHLNKVGMMILIIRIIYYKFWSSNGVLDYHKLYPVYR